jgi:1-acylglycerone phosphate reductase
MGCTVFATARNVDKMGGLDTPIHKLRLDITSDEDVTRVVREVMNVAGKIDILINNAAVDCSGTLDSHLLLYLCSQDTRSRLRGALAEGRLHLRDEYLWGAASHTGGRASHDRAQIGPCHQLLYSCGRSVRIRAASRATSSSLRGCSPTPWGGPYAASKAALVALTDTLDMELRPFNVNVMLLVTGLVRTRMHENAALQQTILPDRSPYAPYAETIAARTKVDPGICMDPNAFAREVVKQALKASPPRVLRLGSYVTVAGVMKCLPRGMLLNMSAPTPPK